MRLDDRQEGLLIESIGQRLRQLWRAWVGEEPDAVAQGLGHYELQRSAQELARVLRQLDLQPGKDYSIRITPETVGVSLHSAKASRVVKSHPVARSVFDRFMGNLGAIEGLSGQPCRFPQHPTYTENWKKMK